MPAISLMIKPSSSLCNMSCKYCFYHQEAVSRDQYSLGFMSKETAFAVIDKALNFADGKEVSFVFQGGEPLLVGIEYYRQFVQYIGKKNAKKSNINLSLQTNGILIDDEWAEFFAVNNFLIGISLDGNKSANRYRVDRDGNNTFEKILGAIDILKSRGVEFNVLVVASSYTAERISEIYRFFAKYGYKYLQFIPCLSAENAEDFSMSVEQYYMFLVKLFDMYIADLKAGKYTSIRYFDNLVRLYHEGQCEQCGVTGNCGLQFVVEGNGNVYPCDFYCLDEWLLGNIVNESLEDLAKKGIGFIQSNPKTEQKCTKCRHLKMCRGGGCRRMRECKDYCLAYSKFFDYATPIIASIRY